MSRSDSPTDPSSSRLILKYAGVALALLSVPIAMGGAYAQGAPGGTLRVLGLTLDGGALTWTSLAFAAGASSIALWIAWGTE